MREIGLNEDSDESAILHAREHSNRSIVRLNLLGVGESFGEDYVGVIGDGTFVPSRAEYLRLFKEGFDCPKQCTTYMRTPEIVNVANDQNLAAEYGEWTARSLPVPLRIPAPTPRCGGARLRAGNPIRDFRHASELVASHYQLVALN